MFMVNALLECVFVCTGATPMEEWGVSDVTRFLNEINYQQYCNIFEHQVTSSAHTNTQSTVYHFKCPNLLGNRWAGIGVAGGQRHGTDAQHETRSGTQAPSHSQLTKTEVNQRKLTP